VAKFAWMCAHEAHQPEVLVEQACQAEEAGFDAVLCSDVFYPWMDRESGAGFAWAWLGAGAARTTRIELITTVTTPLFRYHPAVVAQAAATMDRLSGGRFVLGVGTGDPISDAALGFGPAGYRKHADRLREAVLAIRVLWTGEPVTHRGRWYRLDRARLVSPPVRGIRLWMAADGPASAAMAAEIADGVITSVKDPGATMARVLAPFRQAGGGTMLATRWCVLASDDEAAWRALGPMRGLRVPGRRHAVDPAELRARADAGPREEILSRFARARRTKEMIDVYRPLVDELPVDYVSVQVASLDPDRTIALIGSEVLPALRS
jgi:coenzyme F420-dependent glucose-6-phosphate dehydrogenase